MAAWQVVQTVIKLGNTIKEFLTRKRENVVHTSSPIEDRPGKKKTFNFLRTVAVGVQLYKQYFAYRPYIIYYGNGHWVIRAIFVERVVGNMQVAIR